MRLSEDQIKQDILHAAKEVRSACLRYFAECFSRDQTVMPVVIEALQRHGRTTAFRYINFIANLAQTEETIRWVVSELKDQPRKTDEERLYLHHLSRLLCRADPRLLVPHEKEVLNCRCFNR